jgi:hypothetical protein
MRIEPARVEQVRQAADGRMVLISAEASTIAADLRRIDKGLKVRFAENGNPPFWAVYHESDDGRSTQLVMTAQAHMTASGTWTGLDDRIVKRLEQIDPMGRSGYNYADELEKSALQAARDRKHAQYERNGEIAERVAFTLRKDLGEKYKGRIFMPRALRDDRV